MNDDVYDLVREGAAACAATKANRRHSREDLLQDGLLAVAEVLHRFPDASVPFLGATIRNRILDAVRRKVVPVIDGDAGDVLGRMLGRPEGRFEACELYELLMSVVRAVSPNSRRVLMEKLDPSPAVAAVTPPGQPYPLDVHVAAGLGWSKATVCRASQELRVAVRAALGRDVRLQPCR